MGLRAALYGLEALCVALLLAAAWWCRGPLFSFTSRGVSPEPTRSLLSNVSTSRVSKLYLNETNILAPQVENAANELHGYELQRQDICSRQNESTGPLWCEQSLPKDWLGALKLDQPLPYMKRDWHCLQYRKKRNIMVTFAAPHSSFAPYVELQYRLLKKFVLHDFEYVVYDDSDPDDGNGHYSLGKGSNAVQKSIREVCERLEVTYRRVPQNLHEEREWLFPHTSEPRVHVYNTRAADTFQYMLKDRLCETRYLVLMDADVFLTRPFAVPTYLQALNVDYASVAQGRDFDITYSWNVIEMYDLDEMPHLEYFNHDCGKVCVAPTKCANVDVGGQLHYYYERRVKSSKAQANVSAVEKIAKTGVRWLSHRIIPAGHLDELWSAQGDGEGALNVGKGNSEGAHRCFECSITSQCDGYCTAASTCVPGKRADDDVYCKLMVDSSALEPLINATVGWKGGWDVFEETFVHLHNSGLWDPNHGRTEDTLLQFIKYFTMFFVADVNTEA